MSRMRSSTPPPGTPVSPSCWRSFGRAIRSGSWSSVRPSWNALRELPNLQLPADRNLLVTFHYYDPFHFTHQGASWAGDVKNLHGITWGSAADRAAVAADFDQVAAWSRANDRPILLGEFGAYEKSGTPQDLRVAYTADVRSEAERHGFGWAYWQFEGDFIAWDMARQRWVEPILKALIP